MKKLGKWIINAVVVCGLITSSFGFAGAAEKTTLSFATHYPPGAIYSEHMIQPFCKEVDKRSNGRLNIKPYWSESLIKLTEQLDALSSGNVDIAFFASTYYTGAEPIWAAGQVPFLFDDYKHLARAWKAGINKLWDDAYSRQNIVAIGDFHSFNGVNYLWSNKSVPRLPSDIKGLKIRSYNMLLDILIKSAGAAPTSVSMSDVYFGVQRGTFDGYITNVGSMEAFKLHEVTKYGFRVPVVIGALMPFAINKKIWDKLPMDMKNIMNEVCSEVIRDFNEKSLPKYEDELIEKCKKGGMQIVDPTAAETKAWGDISKPAQEKFLELAGESGRKLVEIAVKTR